MFVTERAIDYIGHTQGSKQQHNEYCCFINVSCDLFIQCPGIDRTAYNVPGLKRTCGDLVSIEDDRSDFNGARLSVEFRANRRLENLGFFMIVTCVNPEFYDLDGCTPAQPARPDVTNGGRRKKRKTKTASWLRYCLMQHDLDIYPIVPLAKFILQVVCKILIHKYCL